ncbi:MAG: hypothetical protein Q9193_002058 [Seirophora villosa]
MVQGRLQGKVAVVTGSSSGLGRAITLLFAAEGAQLIVCADLNPHASTSTDHEADTTTHDLICQQHGKGRAVFIETDVGIGSKVEACVAKAVELGGRLDIMVNNAGLGTENILIHELEEDTWDKMIVTYWILGPPQSLRSEADSTTRRVNLRSVYLGCKYACAQFLKQQARPDGHRGWIINTASILGLVGFAGGAAGYCASKGGVVNLTRQVAIDYAKEKIHCNALCPGFSATAMTKENMESESISARLMSLTPMNEWGKAGDVAKAALFLASEDAAFVTGVALPVDGGMVAQ